MKVKYGGNVPSLVWNTNINWITLDTLGQHGVEVSIQQSRDRPVRLTGDSKLTTGVTVSDGLCLWVTGIDSRRPATLSWLTGYENAWKLQ